MKSIFKKSLALLLVGVLSSAPTIGVYAEDLTQTVDYDSTVNDSSSMYQDVGVSLERAELFSVTLPKSVTLEVVNDDATFDYKVTASGTISSGHFVRVIPMGGSKIIDENEIYTYDLGVTQEKRRWTASELDGTVVADGTYSVTNIEPGKYSGKVRYYITCDDGGIWSPATCTEPARCQGYDDNDNGVLDTEDVNNDGVLTDSDSDGVFEEDINGNGVLDTEYLAVDKYKGDALGHKFEDLANAFPAKCERCGEMIYAISTPEQFTAFRDSVNTDGKNYIGATVCLVNDIDMAGHEWNAPIGTFARSDKHFAGTFDGNGHSIKNLTMRLSSSSTSGTVKYVGLFSFTTTATCVLKNFVLDNAYFEVTDTGDMIDSGGFILGNGDWSADVITNVHVRNSAAVITAGREFNWGGICGDMYLGEISKCSVTNTTVTADAGTKSIYIGGIVGVSPCTSATNTCPDICNTYSAMKVVILSCKEYNIFPFYGDGVTYTTTTNKAVNSVYNSDVIYPRYNGSSVLYDVVYENVLAATDAECKTQAAIDVLNTGLDTPHWKLDLEGINDGYPIPIK